MTAPVDDGGAPSQKRIQAPVRRTSVSDRVRWGGRGQAGSRRGRTRSDGTRRRRGEWPDELAFEDKLADRLNPVFARDLRQWFLVQNVLFVLTMFLLYWVLSESFSLSQTMRSFPGVRPKFLREAESGFFLVIRFLLVVGVVVTPLRAFVSMRNDVDPRAAEQFALSGLAPGVIFRGKAMVALLSMLSLIGLCAPALVAFTAANIVSYGVLFLVAWFLVFVSTAAISIGLAAGARCVESGLKVPLFAMTAIGLSIAALGLVEEAPRLVRELDGVARQGMSRFLALTAVPAVAIVAVATVLGTAAFDQVDTARRTVMMRGLGVVLVTVGSLFGILAAGLAPDGVGLFAAAGFMAIAVGACIEPRRVTRIAGVQGPVRLLMPGRDPGLLASLIGYFGLLACVMPFLGGQRLWAVPAACLWCLVGIAVLYLARQRLSRGRACATVGIVALAAVLAPFGLNAARGVSLTTPNVLDSASPFVIVSRLRLLPTDSGVPMEIFVLGGLAVLLWVPAVRLALMSMRPVDLPDTADAEDEGHAAAAAQDVGGGAR